MTAAVLDYKFKLKYDNTCLRSTWTSAFWTSHVIVLPEHLHLVGRAARELNVKAMHADIIEMLKKRADAARGGAPKGKTAGRKKKPRLEPGAAAGGMLPTSSDDDLANET
jgi:hypothetical protein